MKKEKVTIDVTKLALWVLVIVLGTHTSISYAQKVKGYYIEVGKTIQKDKRIRKGLWRAEAQVLNYKHEDARRTRLKSRLKDNPFKTTYALLAGDKWE